MSIINVEKNGTQYTVVYAVEPSNIKGFRTWAPDYYPIWWGGMPMIMYTFIESYDFSEKTVIPFNTHAGSGQAGTQEEMKSILADVNILDGIAVRGKTAQEDPDSAREDIKNWLSELSY